MNAVAEALKIEGWMSEAELEWLANAASPMKSVVEIGSYKGRSSVAFMVACAGHVYCVDKWKFGSRDAFFQNTEPYRSERVSVIEKESKDAIEDVPSVDMVFIDGEHTFDEVTHDVKAWLPKARRLICGHDYGDEMHLGVAQAVDSTFPAGVERGPGTLWFVRIA